MERASIVYNPTARNAPSLERLQTAAIAMKSHGWDLDLRRTGGAGHATAIAREAAADGARVVFACGGDGTLNEVVNGLAGGPVALGVIRGGMGNVFAKEIGVPRSPEAALQALVEGEVRRFDLGMAGDRYFLLMCGVGFDAEVVRRVPLGAKRLLGTTSYILWGVAGLISHSSRRVRLRLGETERELDLHWLLLGNTRSYGGVLDIAAGAVVDDGLLDTYVYEGRGAAWVALTALRVVTRRIERAPGVSFQRLRDIEVMTPGVSVQADGEYFGETPMRFAVAPQALSILLPPARGRQLFSRPAVEPKAIPGT